ncbi:hypothetical protein KFK09_004087 [Dendrobium nobile]|uniref:Uncharacterized protein n=1 Tax=Dendrobium nobile TaxID=94219 RepID=A0A8T3C4E3_DENNO|nr:hypothetical protein KFK09_004087 [Dendrobium nobile]
MLSPEDHISFSDDEIAEGACVWNQALFGYPIGKRPSYGKLLPAATKLWKLKGELNLLSLSEGFSV